MVRESSAVAPPNEQLLFARYDAHAAGIGRKLFRSVGWFGKFLLSSGSCRPSCLRFEVDGAHVGWIPPQVAALVSRHPEVFDPPRDGAVSLCGALDSYGKRSEAVDAVLQAVRRENRFTCLRGWRDEVREQEAGRGVIIPVFL